MPHAPRAAMSLAVAELPAIVALSVAIPSGAIADPYEWTRWPVPPSRTAFVQVFDPVRHQLVIHGGFGPGPDNNSEDTWSLNLGGAPQWQWRGYAFPRT